MTVTARLREQGVARTAWLDRAVEILDADEAVVAAWLWGSEGRGDADALSDFDLFVALDDVGQASLLAGVEGRFATFGEVVWIREVPYNAPREGRYFSVGYAAPLLPLGVDWYWQPASAASVGNDTRVLVEKAPIPRVERATFQLFPNVESDTPYRHPDDPVERLTGLLVWFWSMFGALGKQAARGQDAKVVEQLPLLGGVLALAAAHVGRPDPPVEPADDPMPRLRALAERMVELGPDLRDAGVAVPDTATAFGWLELAESLRAEGWTPDGGGDSGR